jgi:hypothetical protein
VEEKLYVCTWTHHAFSLCCASHHLGIVVHCKQMSLLQYAQETQHEKILRGLAVGIALTMYGRLEEADPLITSLCQDKDPILRRSGMYTLSMAYCGTGNNQAIRKLLHVAVSVSSAVVLSILMLYWHDTKLICDRDICFHVLFLLCWQYFKLHSIRWYDDWCIMNCTELEGKGHDAAEVLSNYLLGDTCILKVFFSNLISRISIVVIATGYGLDK